MLGHSGVTARWVNDSEVVLIPAVRQQVDVSATAREQQASVATFGNKLLLETPFSVNVVSSEIIEN